MIVKRLKIKKIKKQQICHLKCYFYYVLFYNVTVNSNDFPKFNPNLFYK